MSSSKCVKHIQDENILNNIQNYTKLRQPEQIILIVTEKAWRTVKRRKQIQPFVAATLRLVFFVISYKRDL
jgi:intracellular sulfur oxidation DsrE/DsrF family protein